ncbi:MAG: DUF3592 domain-containing protein [Planctomycetes bacterium]|nr:DUF3592 domain-containing protein [Planctomycetota bacterium]
MDAGRETHKAKLVILFGVFFIVSAYASCREIKFKLYGQTAKGTITNITEAQTSRGRFVGYDLHYQYRDEKGQRTRSGATTVSGSSVNRFEIGQEVEIEFLSGESPTSRIRGEERTSFWPYVFLVSTILLVIGVIHLVR